MYVDRRQFTLPQHETAAGAARRHVASMCDAYDRGLCEVALLLTSELVSNALQHGDGVIELVVMSDHERLRVEVCDQSDSMPRVVGSGPTAIRGRGLMLVARMSSDWGVERAPAGSGKSVWFELRTPPAEFPDEGPYRGLLVGVPA